MLRIPGRLALLVLAVLLGCAIIACDQKSSQPELNELTADEEYLVDAYVDVKLAQQYYPHQEELADSLFADLSATVDTVRIARAIAQLNETPDRWAAVYQAIEERLREERGRSLQRTRARADAPAQVE
jgi:hypothetical protein